MIKQETKISFLCPWGTSSKKLLDYYRLYTPNNSAKWNYLVGVENPADADVVFIMEGMRRDDITIADKIKNKKIFVIRHEPPDVIPDINLGLAAIPPQLRKVATVVDYTKQNIWYLSKWELVYSHTNEDFLNMNYFKKQKKLSCLVSNKSFIPGHKKRLNFINRLISSNENLLDLYGRNKIRYHKHHGELSRDDKFTAYEDYEYTLCFENSYIPNYFSDKIFDSLLMWSMPIYWGAPNIYEYLPQDSLHLLSENLDESDLEKIEHICRSAPSKKNIEAIREARSLILEKYSLWSSLEYIIENY